MAAPQASLPLIAEPQALAERLGTEGLLVVDLRSRGFFNEGHIPGAVHLDPRELVSGVQPAVGALPSDKRLSEILSRLGLTPDTHVIAYDDEGGGWACRLLWTLDVLGHSRFSLLNGGFPAWIKENRPVTRQATAPVANTRTWARGKHGWIDKDELNARLGAAELAIIDARSPAEYSGRDQRAERAGHIPGAVNLNWLDTMDPVRERRLKREEVLRQMLSDLGVSRDKEVVVYCQTHHRSAHTYIMLKALGFQTVRAYAGSWSEWGNSADTPIER